MWCKPIAKCVAVSLALMFMVTGTALAQKVLKLQLVYPKTSSVAANAIFFSEKVEELTNGEIKIKIFYPGQLVKGKEALTAMQRGIIDGYVGSMLYFSGVVPEVNGEWLPFSWRNGAEAMDIYFNHGYLDLMREAVQKQGCYYLAPISVAKMGLLTQFPINTLDDIKGKRIRAVGMEGKIVKALGGSPVSLSGSEQYTGLQRGTVEGTDYPWYTLRDYKFYEVVSYVSSPPIHSPGMVEILFDGQLWNGLTDAQKEALNKAGHMTSMHSADLAEKNDEEIIAFCKENKITFIELAEGEVEKMIKTLQPVYEEHQNGSDINRRQVEVLKAYFKEKNIKHPLLN